MREHIRMMEAELDRLGYPWCRQHGGKHDRFVVNVRGRVLVIPCSCTPANEHGAGQAGCRQIRAKVVEAVRTGRSETERRGAA